MPHRLLALTLLNLIAFCFPAAAEVVTDQDVARYVATFRQRPMPIATPEADYRSMVNQLRTPVAWLIGSWRTPDGELNIYPSAVRDRVCVVVKSKRTVAYAEGRLQGAYLRTENPLFTEAQFLKYAASDVLVPVLYKGKAYLGWGLYDRSHRQPRFLTLAFHNAPSALETLLPPDQTGAAIKAQFLAAGCRSGSALQRSVGAKQTIGNVTIQAEPGSVAQNLAQTIQIQIENKSDRAFGFMPNQVAIYNSDRRRIPAQFSTLVHGTVVQPNGMLRGAITTRRQSSPLFLQIVEATSDRRTFNLRIP